MPRAPRLRPLRLTPSALRLLLVLLVALSSGLLFGKVTQPRPRYSSQEIPPEKACSERQRAFPHASHLGFTGGACDGCHVLVTRQNALPGEKPGEIRRPNHAPCLECHSDHPSRPSFFEKDDAKRIICQSCHTPRRDEKGAQIPGSENDAALAPGALDYSAPDEKPCDLSYGLDFSHKAHKDRGCDTCHSPLGDPKDPAGALMVSTPGHPECFHCHDEGKSKAAIAAATPKDCAACHRLKGSPEARLSYTSGGRADFAHKFGHQSHMKSLEAAFPGKGQNARCNLCHTSLAETKSLLEPAAKDHAKDASFTSTCFCCHYEKSPVTFGPKSCKSCHAKVDIPVAPGTHARGICSQF